MKTCPHCQFLVTDGATTCSVCHRDITSPQTPAEDAGFANPYSPLAPGSAGVAPGSTFPPPTPGTAVHGSGVPAAPTPKASTGRALLILGAVVVGLVAISALGIGAMVLLADSTEVSSGSLSWENYQDPDGRFQLEMPGKAVSSTIEMPTAVGGRTEMDVVNVFGSDFVATVNADVGTVAEGLTFADIPFSADGAVRGAETTGFLDGEVVSHEILEGRGDTQLEMEMTGVVAGEPAVMISRLVLIGPSLYEISLAGQRDQRDELIEIHERMAESFG